jgi:energy-coupling factor transport system ATP-binding protein
MQIKFSDVSHLYHGIDNKATAGIKDITLDLSERSIVAIVGSTGSGKSTAMQHINGLLQPTSGQMHVGTEVITHKKNRHLATIRAHIGYVFQNAQYQLFAASVLEDVMYGPLNFGFSASEAKQAALDALACVGVPEVLYERYPFDLSGGQMRKVALAGALAYNPEVLILDEPSVGLDPLATEEMMALFNRLYEDNNKSLIFITHDMELVAKLARRVLVFSAGEIVFDGTPFELFFNEEVLTRYGLAMPDLFKLATGLCDAGLKLPLTAKNFSLETIIDALRSQKELK